jgi:guanylate kinase
MSVSYTTRPMRAGEVDGKDYHFTSREEFDRLVGAGAFLEHATVFGNSYGTPRGPVEAALAAGRDLLFDIDWQGEQQIAESVRGDHVSVFILPPSAEELRRRLTSRGLDSEETVARRMAVAGDEMAHYQDYNYVVVNADLATSIARVRTILAAERLRRERQIGLYDFVRSLQGGI